MSYLDRQTIQISGDCHGYLQKRVGMDSPPDLFRWEHDWQATAHCEISNSASTDLVSVERATGKLSSRPIVPSTDTGSVEGVVSFSLEAVAVQSPLPPARGRWGNPETGSRVLRRCGQGRSFAHRRRLTRRGLSLLEVILAIAILGGALATIGHLVRLGSRSAVKADRLNTAQIICQTKMAEITSGAVPPAPVGWTSYEFDPEWQYMVDMVPVESVPGLVSVRVSAQENLPVQQQPVAFTLTRWLPDPSLDLEAQNEAYKEAAALAEEQADE